MAASSSGQGAGSDVGLEMRRPCCPSSSSCCPGGEHARMERVSSGSGVDVGIDVDIDIGTVQVDLTGGDAIDGIEGISSSLMFLDMEDDNDNDNMRRNFIMSHISNDAISAAHSPATVAGNRDINANVMRICQVCCERVPASSMSGCSGCSHKYCVACIGRYWETQIFSGHHARLTCLHGGCGTAASDSDVLRVVTFRVYRRMIYFRARDRYPDANFCPYDTCWERLDGINGNGNSNNNNNNNSEDRSVRCGRCDGKICTRCFEPDDEDNAHAHTHCDVNGGGANGVGNGRRKKLRIFGRGGGINGSNGSKKQRTHELSFKLWAMTHTKTCPTCNSRIQRAKGCSHMTCIKCSAYFCWRCKGYLNADCIIRGSSNNGGAPSDTSGDSTSGASSSTNTGFDAASPASGRNMGRNGYGNGNGNKRACICDKVLTSIAYGGLISIAILGSPLFLSAAVVGGPPWLIYRVVKRSGSNSNSNNNPNSNSNSNGNGNGNSNNGINDGANPDAHHELHSRRFMDSHQYHHMHYRHMHGEPQEIDRRHMRPRARGHRADLHTHFNDQGAARREFSMRVEGNNAERLRRRQQVRRRNSE